MTFIRQSACLIVTIALMSACGRGKPDSDDAPKRATPTTKPASRTPAGDPIVRLEPASQNRIGIRTEAAVAQDIQPDLVAYGRLEEDPSRVFVVRAPVAGTLRATSGRAWPRLGDALADNTAFGGIAPQLAPAERIALTNQFASARADLTASELSAAAAKAAYERARQLNADNKNVSDRALEDAAARAAAEDAKVKTATDTVHLLEDTLRPSGAATTPLSVERGGEVVEMMAQPGEAVEPGTAILRVARFDRLIAQVDIPVGEHVPASSTKARLFAIGYEDRALTAERLSLVAKADPTTQGESVLFRVSPSVAGLRPGLAVTARIPISGTTRHGVVIPPAALVRVSGRAYVFVQTSANEFVRREVTLDQPIEAGFLAPASVAPGERLVIQGAQLLLSEEFRAELAAENDKS